MKEPRIFTLKTLFPSEIKIQNSNLLSNSSTAELNHQMKQKKQAHLPQKRLGKRTSQQILSLQQKAFLHLNPNNLSIQRAKRMHATELTFSYNRRIGNPVGISKPLVKAMGFPKNTQELYLSLPMSFKDQDYSLLAQNLKRFKS